MYKYLMGDLKLLFSTGSIYKSPLEKSFYIASEAGFDGVEVVMNELYYKEETPEHLKELSKIIKIQVLHAPFIVEGSSKTMVVSLLETIKIAEILGIKKIVFHPPLKPWMDLYYWMWFRKTEFFHFQKKVKLCLENMPFKKFFKMRICPWSIKNHEKMKNLAKRKNLYIAFDTTHCGTTGKNLKIAFEKLGGCDLIKHIHLSDFKEEKGKLLEHLFPGEGILPIFEFIRFLKELGYKETITIEVTPDCLPDSDMEKIKKLRELLNKIREVYYGLH